MSLYRRPRAGDAIVFGDRSPRRWRVRETPKSTDGSDRILHVYAEDDARAATCFIWCFLSADCITLNDYATILEEP